MISREARVGISENHDKEIIRVIENFCIFFSLLKDGFRYFP